MSPFLLRADADSGADTPTTSEQTETNTPTTDATETDPTNSEVTDPSAEAEQPEESNATTEIQNQQVEGGVDGEGGYKGEQDEKENGQGEGVKDDAAKAEVENQTDSPPSDESQTLVPEAKENTFENFDSNNDMRDQSEEQVNDENNTVPTKFTVESQVEEEEIQDELSHPINDEIVEDENIESNEDTDKQNQEEAQGESKDSAPDAAEAEKDINQSKNGDNKNDENKNNKKKNNKKNDPIERKPVPRPSKAERNQPKSNNPQQINIEAQQPYNTTTNNIYNYKFVGGEGGKDFAIQVKNEVVKKIKVIFNMKRVTRMELTFQGDSKESKKVQTQGKSFQEIREYTEFTSEFEFQPGEYLKGEMVIATNSDTLTVRTRDVGYIYFNTVFGRTFEAGNRKQATKDVHYRFDVDKHFFAGVFGRALKYINCLGLLLYQKISSDRFDNLKFPEVNKSDFKIKIQDGETTKICNNDPSNKPIAKNLKQPVPDGEYRAVWLDHPYYNINYITYTKNIQVPTVSESGKVTYETMSFAEFVKDTKFVNNQSTKTVELEKGECATIKQSAKIAMQDNIPFDLKHKFNIGDLKNYTQDVQLRGYTSMEKKIQEKAEVIYTDKDNKIIKKKERKPETKSNPIVPKGDKSSNADKPTPMYSQNITTEDKKGNIMVGGPGGKFFSSQKPRNIISSFKAMQNNTGIKKIIIQYFGDPKVHEFGAENINNKWQSKEIKFEQGEQLVGNIKLIGNKDGASYIQFQTLQGQTFEAGQLSDSSDSIIFPAKMTFLSGIQGQENQSINKLGFILYKKFDKVTQSTLKWPTLDKIEFKYQEQKGESKLVCNTDKKEKEVELAYPSASGEYRTVEFDHKVQSAKDITLEKVSLPSMDATGKKEVTEVSSLEEKSFSSTNVKVKIPLKSGQCVQLKQSVKTVEHDNLKFTIKQEFQQDNKIERYALINGAMSFKKVISSNVQPVFSNKVAKTLLQMHRDSLLEQQFFG